MTNSTLIYLVKMEYVSEINIFCLITMVKSDLKNYFEIPPCGSYFFLIYFTSKKGGLLHKITNSLMKITLFAHGGVSIFFL